MSELCCSGCGFLYGDPTWIEAVVSDAVWEKISLNPNHGSGILCIQCIANRCVEMGLADVKVSDMELGMMWFDRDPKTTLVDKIDRASVYYQKKYGEIPNQCFVHPNMLGEDGVDIEGLKVVSSQYMLPNHLWIGVGADLPLAKEQISISQTEGD